MNVAYEEQREIRCLLAIKHIESLGDRQSRELAFFLISWCRHNNRLESKFNFMVLKAGHIIILLLFISFSCL